MSEGREPDAAPRRGRDQADAADPAHARADRADGGGSAGDAGLEAGAATGGADAADPQAASTSPPPSPGAGDDNGPSTAAPAPAGADAEQPPGGAAGAAAAAPPAERRGFPLLALLALLIACAALAAIAWPYWMLYRGQDPLAVVDSERVAAFETRIAELENTRTGAERAERAAQAAAQEAEAAARRAGDATAAVGALREAFADLSASTMDAAPLDDRQWRLAEAAYLLRVANLRARMENDRDGARALLEAADELIADLDDYGLFPVREEISRALTALRGQPVVDRVGLYLELQQLGERIAALPLDLPEYLRQAPSVEEGAAWYEQLGARVAGLFEFRVDRSEPVRPLLPPDEAVYLRHNLQLHLEQAQLALLRGDATVWQATLTEAQGWVQDHFEPEHADAVALTNALTRLMDERIEVLAPDISGPLTALQRLRGRGIPESSP